MEVLASKLPTPGTGATPPPDPSEAEEVRGYYRRVLPFYDRELADRGDEVFWTWAAATPAGCRVLEIGAGTGRATAFLARSAGRVTAFDLSPDLLAVARRRLADFPNVRLLLADMRASAVDGPFDLVAAVDDPFVHLTEEAERAAAFAEAARRVARGGRLLLDAAWFPPGERHAAGWTGGLVKEHEGEGGLGVRQVWHCDPESRLCEARFEYRQEGQELERATFPARLWSREELEERAGAAGLEVASLWGDFDRSPWERATSPRLIAELRRPGGRRS